MTPKTSVEGLVKRRPGGSETADTSTANRSARQALRKGRRIVVIVFSILSLCVLGLAGALALLSPGKPKPVVDQNGRPIQGSISEKIRVNIGGVEQGMFIKSKDAHNPVLLYVPGTMPDYFLTERYPTGLENLFTVVWWEQRGSGLSYSPDMAPGTVTLERLISDTLELTNYLRERFGQDKIYLMAHSGGTFSGIQAVARAPELYHAYIGVAQMSNQLESELLTYQYMLDQYKKNGNATMVRKLEAAPVTRTGGVPPAYSALLRDVAMHDLGLGTMHNMRSIVTGLLLPSFLQNPEYTLAEKVNTWRAKSAAGVNLLRDLILATDLSRELPEVRLPVYFFEGAYDGTCAYSVAKSYFETLTAPVKGFYTFENSAHSPMFEEPEKTMQILREDVLRGTNRLADGT